MNEKGSVSNAFQTFMKEAPEHQKIWMETVQNWIQQANLTQRQKNLHILLY